MTENAAYIKSVIKNDKVSYNRYMKFRSVFICLLAFMPLATFADEGSGGQAQAPQTAVGASDLLPQSGTANGGVSSTGAGSVLQPNASSLQGTSNDGSALSAPSSQNLQAAPATEGLKVLLGGEADGSPKTIDSTATSSLGEDITSIALGVLILCVALGILRRRAKQSPTIS